MKEKLESLEAIFNDNEMKQGLVFENIRGELNYFDGYASRHFHSIINHENKIHRPT